MCFYCYLYIYIYIVVLFCFLAIAVFLPSSLFLIPGIHRIFAYVHMYIYIHIHAISCNCRSYGLTLPIFGSFSEPSRYGDMATQNAEPFPYGCNVLKTNMYCGCKTDISCIWGQCLQHLVWAFGDVWCSHGNVPRFVQWNMFYLESFKIGILQCYLNMKNGNVHLESRVDHL